MCVVLVDLERVSQIPSLVGLLWKSGDGRCSGSFSSLALAKRTIIFGVILQKFHIRHKQAQHMLAAICITIFQTSRTTESVLRCDGQDDDSTPLDDSRADEPVMNRQDTQLISGIHTPQ